MELISERLQKMAKVKDISNIYKSQEGADTPALAASATDVVSHSEFLLAGNEINRPK